MSKPIYCPNCATKIPDISFNLKEFTSLIYKDKDGNERTATLNGWGVECDSCGWIGEILPASEDDLV